MKTKEPRLFSPVASAAVGAGLMYFLDPKRGHRRRALLYQKSIHAWHRTERLVFQIWHDLSNRSAGSIARWKIAQDTDRVSDHILVERVRSKLGRAVSHPHQVSVTADTGRVTLEGFLSREETNKLLTLLQPVRGITKLENRCRPPIQRSPRQLSRDQPSLWQKLNPRSPTMRLGLLGAGGLLVNYGSERTRPIKWLALGIGLPLLARGFLPRQSEPGKSRLAKPQVEFHQTWEIRAPADHVFAFWMQKEAFPHFLSAVNRVESRGPEKSCWEVVDHRGEAMFFDAFTTRLVPERLISWETVPIQGIHHSGSLELSPCPLGTRLTLKLQVKGNSDRSRRAIARFFSAGREKQIQEDLIRVKRFIETGIAPQDTAERPAVGI